MATKSVINEKLKQEQRIKEDKAFYTMMVAFVVAFVIEFALVTLYRRYAAGENYRPVLRIIMWIFLGITALSGIGFIYSAATKRFKYLKPLFAVGAVFFGCAVILRLTNIMGYWAITVLQASCTVVPVAALLYVVFLIYQIEFFMSALFGSLGIFTMWYTQKVFYIRYFKRLYVMGGVTALLVVVAALTFYAMKNKGYIGGGEYRLRVFSPKTSYKSLYTTYAVTLGLFLVYLLIEKLLYPMIIPVIIAFAAYVFVTAIYYTIKLM